MISFGNQRKNESHEYPGAYHPPSYNWTKVMQQLRETAAEGFKPAVNISENPGYYCIEVKAPGYNKEDFIVTIEGGKLNIYGISPACDAGERSGYPLHGQGYDCFEHAIDLPKYIDTDFVRAEYKAGVLRFDFPKADYEDACTVERIIVY
ncbi:Hsp20/alpha crystallin family protein [Agriterribacter sp.]|uniref:Hsp20/alpha crystallin family protein n=1 Tax=Agriterribacter sp. TaxID=2821509 RepID=UPI002C1A6C0A|nr:Hsp20/alpha crystallin family protein [Agriterribacter sp.]HRO47371.1 Hsp20/alpha crystallin family protein [Agriterribacter sp.]HRQ18806.1 Hsp20/alpha crystallin family protein [Agriterribacter sp.]